MVKVSENSVLKEIFREIQTNKIMRNEHLTRLSTMLGSRFDRAWKALRERRVKKYIFKPSGRIVWIVVGKRRDYLVMSDAQFCSCEDFYFKFDKGHLCYHIIAQKLAEATHRFDLIEDEDRFHDILIKEWKAVETRVSKKHKKKSSLNNL